MDGRLSRQLMCMSECQAAVGLEAPQLAGCMQVSMQLMQRMSSPPAGDWDGLGCHSSLTTA